MCGIMLCSKDKEPQLIMFMFNLYYTKFDFFLNGIDFTSTLLNYYACSLECTQKIW